MAAIGGAIEIIEAWPGAVLFHEYGSYPDEEANLWVANLGQASKEAEVVIVNIARPPASEPILCYMPIDG